MNKKLYSLMLTLLALMGVMSSCSEKEDIIFDHERQQFETRADRILLEFIAPFGTTADEEIYILGAFNGDSTAIGQEQYLLTKAPNSNVKFGIYLDPSTFTGGKTLADGFRFYSATQGMEFTINGEAALHNDNPSVGTFTNVWGQRWESYYWAGGEAPEPEHDGFAVYVDDQTGWDALTLYMWGDVNNLNGDWPGMQVTGTWKNNGITWKYFDMGAANTGLAENLIFNNGGNGVQLADFAFTIDRNIYLRITADGVEEIGLEPSVKHDGYAVFVIDDTGWDVTTLYMWGDVNNLNGDWPGMEVTGEQTINGNTYKYFDMGEANTGLAENLIFSNNGASQLGDFAYTIDHDVYLHITTSGVEEIDPATYQGGGATPTPEPQPSGETHKFYIHDLTGWGSVGLYAWGDGLPELFGGWPGKTDYTTQTIGGIEFKVFEFTSNGEVYNPILNGDGGQIDGPAVTTDKDRYFEVTASSFTEIEKPAATGQTHFAVYVNNQTGWDGIALYAWGDTLPELFGGWPGNNAPAAKNFAGTDYLAFEYDGVDLEYHLIFNNNSGGTQFDGPVLTIGNDFYMNVTATECQDITHKIYIDDQTGWDEAAIYAWGDNIAELYGGWPGKNVYGTETIDGVTYKVFTFPATGQTYNPIFNNNGGGLQCDGPAIVLDKDYFFTVTASGWTAKARRR